GAEFWDFSLVDPDNRSPVNFDQRQVAFAVEPGAQDLIENWRDGRIKQWLITQVLALRAAQPDLFRHGSYQPLPVEGECAERVVAFARHYDQQDQDQWLIVIAPRMTVALLGNTSIPHIPADHWGDTYVQLPAEISNRCVRGVLFNPVIATA